MFNKHYPKIYVQRSLISEFAPKLMSVNSTTQENKKYECLTMKNIQYQGKNNNNNKDKNHHYPHHLHPHHMLHWTVPHLDLLRGHPPGIYSMEGHWENFPSSLLYFSYFSPSLSLLFFFFFSKSNLHCQSGQMSSAINPPH